MPAKNVTSLKANHKKTSPKDGFRLCCNKFFNFKVMTKVTKMISFYWETGITRPSKSHVSANIVVPELKAFTITVWMKTEQDGAGTLLSYATKIQSEEFVIRTHPRIKLTCKGSSSSELSATLKDGRWYFVSIQWKSSNGKWKVFVDNVSQSTITTTLGRG